MTPALMLYLLFLTNAGAFILMIVDKRRAESGARRISEATLLGWMLLGGTPGGFIASRLVRHKTRKQPFASIMMTVLWTQIIIIGMWQLGFIEPLIALVMQSLQS
jgi:uncharacterized membrane protein YsdA (DUF1294 family)